MREFLEEALSHQDAGQGRQQRDVLRELPKRFYERAEVVASADGFTVALDGRVVKTPTRKLVAVPSHALAVAMCAEWEAQGSHVDPDLMPHVKLVNSAVEGGAEAREDLIAEIIKYAGNDLLLYRAESPRELVALQEQVWDDVLVRLARHLAVSFRPTVGIVHQAQPPETLVRLAEPLATLDFMTATALVSITGLTGSGLLALGLSEALIDADTVWRAAHVDEDYQIAQWGEDYEAAARRKQRRKEFDAAVNVVDWLKAG